MNQQQQYNPNLNTPGNQQGNYVMNQTIDTSQQSNSMNIQDPINYQAQNNNINASKTLKINQMDWAMVIMCSALLGSCFFNFCIILFSPIYMNFEFVLRAFLVPIGIATLSWVYILFQNREGMGKILLLSIFLLSYGFGIWNIVEIGGVPFEYSDGYQVFAYTFTLIFMGSFLNLLPGTYALIRVLQIQFNNTKDKLNDYDIFTFFATVAVSLLWAMGLQAMYQFGILTRFSGPSGLVILAVFAAIYFLIFCPVGLHGCIKHNKGNMMMCAVSSILLWAYFFIYFIIIIDQYVYIGSLIFISIGTILCSIVVLVNALRPQPKHLQTSQNLLPN